MPLARDAETRTDPGGEGGVLPDAAGGGPGEGTRVFAIWTRDEHASAATGRGKITQEVRAAIDDRFRHVRHHRLRHALQLGLPRGLAALLGEAARGFARDRALPLQCRIFLPRTQEGETLRAIRAFGPGVVYLDSIRAAPLAPAIRAAFPGVRIVLDMDDLMSRRYAFYDKSGIDPGFGFLERYLPGALLRSGFVRGLTGRLWRDEARRLLASELALAASVDRIVLISPYEATLLARVARRASRGAGRPLPVVSIPPPVELPPPGDRAGEGGPRFVFIGTDGLPQNRRTIEEILALWTRLRPRAPVHLYGRMREAWPAVEGVRFEGFARDLEDVYAPGSVLFAPSYVKGGIKTKVLEAFAFGCPVAGNRASFEGIEGLERYPLVLDEAGLARLVEAPDAHREALVQAGRIGRELVERHYDRALFRARWCDLLAGARPAPVSRPAPASPFSTVGP